MKKIIVILITLISLYSSFLLNNCISQWVQISNGLNRGYVRSVAANGNNLLAATNYSGIEYSTDSGNTWLFTNLINATCTAVAINDSACLAGTTVGVFLSTNNGQDWIGSSLSAGCKILCFSGSYCISGTGGIGIYISSDHGYTWPYQRLGLEEINSLFSAGNSVFAGTNTGVFYSSNNGFNWTNILSGKRVLSVTKNSSKIFAGTDSSLFISSDNGVSWIQSSLINMNVTTLATNSQNIIAGTNNGIYLSTNEGVTWAFSNLANNYITSFSINNNKLYASSRDSMGIYVSTNFGSSWYGTNLNNLIVMSITSVGNNIFTGTDRGLFYSTNEGANWIPISFPNKSVKTIMNIGAGIVFAGTDTGLYKSIDDGMSWALYYFQNNKINCTYLLNNFIFVGTTFPARIFRSSNMGINWDTVFYGGKYINSFAHTNINNSLKIFATIVYEFGNTNGVISSTNLGDSWVYNPLSQGHFTAVSCIGSNVIAGSLPSGIGTFGAYVSTNNGANWNYSKNWQIACSIAYDNIFVLGSSNYAGISYTTNNGANWYSNNIGLGSKTIYSFYDNSNYLYAGTWGTGIYRINKNVLVSSLNTSSTIPEAYSLSQNYPNPFNPTTKIKFEVSKSDNVTIIIYDITGREIQTLVNERLQTGTYETTFDGSQLTSGVYFYRMLTDGFSETKKMLLIK